MVHAAAASTDGGAIPSLGVLNFADGSLTSQVYGYFSSILQPSVIYGPSYTVDPVYGRVDLGPDESPSDAIYLTNPIDGIGGFYLTSNYPYAFGTIEAQPAASYSDSSVAGNYYVGQDELSFTNLVGTASISSAGSVAGTADESSVSGLAPNQPFSLSLAINADGTGNAGANTFALTNGSKVFVLQQSSDTGSQVTVLDQKQ